LEHVLRIVPEHVESIVDMAVLELNRGDFEAGLARLENAQQLEAENVRAHFYRGLALEQLGRIDEARDEMTAVARGADKHAIKAARWIERHQRPC
jgi:tetratricopeptide (TPR) repeat protein